MHDAMPAGIWPHNLLLPRQGNGHTRHTLSIQSPTFHWISLSDACIMPDHKEAFQQAFISDPEMQALTDLMVTGWPKDIKEVPHPLCPYWQHRVTLQWGQSSPARWSTHHPSCKKGESPASTASIPSRNNEVTVACMWKFLLAPHQ